MTGGGEAGLGGTALHGAVADPWGRLEEACLSGLLRPGRRQEAQAVSSVLVPLRVLHSDGLRMTQIPRGGMSWRHRRPRWTVLSVCWTGYLLQPRFGSQFCSRHSLVIRWWRQTWSGPLPMTCPPSQEGSSILCLLLQGRVPRALHSCLCL